MTNFKQLFQILTLLIAAIAVQACSSDAGKPLAEANSSDLLVSASDLYWGTRDVGAETTQIMTLSNQSSNVIRINSVSITGANAKEFNSSLDESVALAAGESIDIAISFTPQSEGRKYASLDIDYDRL
ncbi:MAG: choice-of-anchor D domain-containing protein [Gammaproteobacteria bacterium]|nr:choice-of-anchor D domain-containing protein [Gammaproteobacteria bacterium]